MEKGKVLRRSRSRRHPSISPGYFHSHLEAHRPHLIEWKSPTETVRDYSDETNLVLVFHDECVFHANDGQGWSWVFKGRHKLRPKGNGRGLHRSDFTCSTVGWLKDAGQSMAIGNPQRVLDFKVYIPTTSYCHESL